VIATTLVKGDGSGIWIQGRRGFQVQAHRLMFGSTTVGVLVIGYALDDRIARTVHLRTGGIVAIRLNNEVIVSSPLDGENPAPLGELSKELADVATEPKEVKVDGEHYLAVARTFPERADLQYVLMRSLERALDPGRTLVRLVYIIAGIGMLIALVFAVGFARRLSGPIDRLVRFTREITSGNLDRRAEISGPIEVRALGDAMNYMAVELERSRVQLASTTKRLEQEMEIASKIQTSILPKMIEVKRLEIAAKMVPATEVGGDYYDVLPVDDGCWIGIGDVAGHGVTAGLVMMMMQSVVAAVTRNQPTAAPKDVVSLLNAILYENIRHRLATDSHVTATLLRYTCDGKIVFAGRHEDLIIYRAATKSCERVATTGMWLGIERDLKAGTVDIELALADGDVLVLYTDGVLEARDAGRQEFGEDRLCSVIERHGTEPVDRIVDGVVTAVQEFAVQQRDDVTLVVMRYHA
jgi:sigma-B regulation protein RsbU (phosphoserine phosphatase)